MDLLLVKHLVASNKELISENSQLKSFCQFPDRPRARPSRRRGCGGCGRRPSCSRRSRCARSPSSRRAPEQKRLEGREGH